jgi:hypothetical protein
MWCLYVTFQNKTLCCILDGSKWIRNDLSLNALSRSTLKHQNFGLLSIQSQHSILKNAKVMFQEALLTKRYA